MTNYTLAVSIEGTEFLHIFTQPSDKMAIDYASRIVKRWSKRLSTNAYEYFSLVSDQAYVGSFVADNVIKVSFREAINEDKEPQP